MFAHERTRPKLHLSRTKQVLYKTHAQLSDIEHLPVQRFPLLEQLVVFHFFKATEYHQRRCDYGLSNSCTR